MFRLSYEYPAILPGSRLEHAIEGVENLAALDPEAMDLTIKNPDALRKACGHAVTTATAIELAVETHYAPSIEAVRNNHPVFDRTTPHWNVQETQHGIIGSRFMQAMRLEPLSTAKLTGHLQQETAVNIVLGLLPRSGSLIVDGMIARIGELNEFMTGKAYRRMGSIAMELGELAFDQAVNAMSLQEAKHLALYGAVREWIDGHMNAPERWVTKQLFKRRQQVVGTAEFGEEAIGFLLQDLLKGGISDKFVKDVQQKACYMLEDDANTNFTRSVKRSLELVALNRAT